MKKGFGGKFGIQDHKDKSALGYEENTQVELHPSQTDMKKGFGGKYGVQESHDKSALSYDADTKVELHSSQIDMKKGFGGKFGVESDKKDKVCKDIALYLSL